MLRRRHRHSHDALDTRSLVNRIIELTNSDALAWERDAGYLQCRVTDSLSARLHSSDLLGRLEFLDNDGIVMDVQVSVWSSYRVYAVIGRHFKRSDKKKAREERKAMRNQLKSAGDQRKSASDQHASALREFLQPH